jgi:hypothetical protein
MFLEELEPIHAEHLLSYRDLTNTSVGLLINLGAPARQDGLRRNVGEECALRISA